jgi:hypothetical protein
VTNYFQKAYTSCAVSNEKPSFPEFMLTDSEKVSYNVTDRGILPTNFTSQGAIDYGKKYTSGYM